MSRRVTPDQVPSVLDDLSFPIVRSDAAVELSETIVTTDTGDVNLGELVSEADSDTYQSEEALLNEIRQMLPRQEP